LIKEEKMTNKTNKDIRILNVEDEDVDHMAFLRMVKAKELPYHVERASSLAEAEKMLNDNVYDVVLLDYMMPNGTGLAVLEKIKGTPSIFVTGSGDEMVAVKAMKGGAYDYIIKDPQGGHLELLPLVIEKAIKRFEDEETASRNYDEIKRLNKLMVGREIRMGEIREENERLKKEIERLKSSSQLK